MIKNTDAIQANQILFKNTDNSLYVQTMIDNIKNSFTLSPSYFQVTKYPENTTLYDAWILKMKDDEEKDGIEKKQIILKPNQLLEHGDYINWQNEVWLTVDTDTSPYYSNGNLQKCNQSFLIKADDGTIQTIYGVFSFLTRNYIDVDNGKLISIPKDSFVVKIQSNKYSKQIIESYRIIINGKVYKCVAVADILVKNIIELKLILDLKRDSDNFVTGIADQTIQQVITPSNLAISGTTNPKTSSTNTYTILNNTNNNTFTWSLVDAISGLATTYGSITSSTTTTCTVSIGTTSGKQIKLLATCIESPSTVLSMILTSSAGF